MSKDATRHFVAVLQCVVSRIHSVPKIERITQLKSEDGYVNKRRTSPPYRPTFVSFSRSNHLVQSVQVSSTLRSLTLLLQSPLPVPRSSLEIPSRFKFKAITILSRLSRKELPPVSQGYLPYTSVPDAC